MTARRDIEKRGRAANLCGSELLVATQTAQQKRYGKEGLQGGPLVKRSWSPSSGSLGVGKGGGGVRRQREGGGAE